MSWTAGTPEGASLWGLDLAAAGLVEQLLAGYVRRLANERGDGSDEQGRRVSGQGARMRRARCSDARLRCRLDRAHKEFRLRRCIGVEHDSDAGEAGRNLLEQVEPFAADRELVQAEAG